MIIFFLIFLFLGMEAKAEDVNDISLQVVYQDQTESPENEILWAESCKCIGDNLEVQKGPWGWGIFQNTTCLYGTISNETKQSPWQLLISKNDNHELNFNIKFQGIDKANLSIPLQGLNPFEVLSNEEKMQSVALGLLDQLPIAMQIPDISEDQKKIQIPFNSIKSKDISPPEKLILYTIFWDSENKLFNSSIVGLATLDGPFWTVLIKNPPKSSNQKIWAHNSEGPGFIFNSKNTIASDASSLVFYYEYGKPIMNDGLYGNAIESHTFALDGVYPENFVGKNLGLRWQFNPKKSVTTSGLQTSVSSSKFFLTYNFDYRPVTYLGLRITPFGSIWQYSLEYPRYVKSEKAWVKNNFLFTNQLAIGLEAKLLFTFFRLYRLQSFFSYEDSLNQSNVKSMAYKYGYSIIYDLPHLKFFGKTNWWISGGYSQESFSLQSEINSDDTFIKSILNIQNSINFSVGVQR